jgi:putative DNA primase/helicase
MPNKEILARSTPITAQELAARLNGCSSGSAWTARCPGHDDAHASLAIAEGKDGRVLLKCHAGCTTTKVATALGLTLRDLMGESRRQSHPQRPKIIATYDYEDEQDELLYQAVRYEPKDFRQRRPAGKDKWTWKLGDVRRVIFALPTMRLQLNNLGMQQYRREHGLPDDVFVTEARRTPTS